MIDLVEITNLFRLHYAAENTARDAWQRLTAAIPDNHSIIVRLPDGKVRMVLQKSEVNGKQVLSWDTWYNGEDMIGNLEITVPEPRNEWLKGGTLS